MIGLGIDYGAKHIGVALVDGRRVLYAATIEVAPKALSELVKERAKTRRIRRTRRTHRSRLNRLRQAIDGIPGAKEVLRFCRRRGYSYKPKKKDLGLSQPRSAFFDALRKEVARRIQPDDEARVLRACSKHLNEQCRRGEEIRPARFDNRNPPKCRWEGCNRNTPRTKNALRERLQQALFAWLCPVFEQTRDRPALRGFLEDLIGDMVKRPDDHKACYARLRERVKAEATPAARRFIKNWKEHYCKNVTSILTKEKAGRIRYCRDHSRQYVEYLLDGKEIPNKIDGKPVGRKQAIVFSRLWRLIECRILPLVDHIDYVTVERVAFDVLAGKWKKRQKLSPSQAEQMYWQGPQFGFDSRPEMLQEEFDGRCAYCGQAGLNLQEDHLMAHSAFPYDSYFAVLPSCAPCNDQKGTQPARKIHPEAYKAYAQYVEGSRSVRKWVQSASGPQLMDRKLTVPHVYHTVKKGLLNLWQNGIRIENHLRMIGENLMNIAGAQAAPRNLGRYLAARLKCKHRALSGRHTALYRSIVLRGYVKETDPVHNHAVDAILLACDFPSAPAFDAGRCDARAWRQRVLEAAPGVSQDGLPVVEAPAERVYFFERDDLGNGYLRIDLSAFNWNWNRRSGCLTDPVGSTADGQAAKRIPAQEMLDNLPAVAGAILHARLRRLLESDPQNARRNFIVWLQRSVRLPEGNHPSDEGRRRMLQKFMACSPESILSGEEEDQIPYTIGVRCLKEGGKAKYNVTREGKPGSFAAHPQYRAIFVGYRAKTGELDRSKPILLYVDQTGAVLQGSRHRPVIPGRPLGARAELDFATLGRELRERFQLDKLFHLTQGCVIQKMNGTRFQLRNFDTAEAWMKASSFRDIRCVYRSPLVVEGLKTRVTQRLADKAITE